MKRIAVLILALCLMLAMTACDLVQQVKDGVTKAVTESIGGVIGEVGELAGQMTEWKYGQLIYTEVDNFSINETGVTVAMHTETRYSYDDNGNQILCDETTTYDDGTPTVHTVSENVYDAEGRMLKSSYTVGGETGSTEYEYDADGHMVKMVTTYADGTQSVSTSEYDAEGRETRSTFRGTEGDHNESAYTYDERGFNVSSEWSSTYGDGTSSTSRNDETYDDDGNVLRSVYIYNGEQQSVTDYEYDAEGRLLKETYTELDGWVTMTEYTYDENGNEIEQATVDKDGNYSSVQRKEYDENGNLLRSEYESSSGRSLDVYSYDENGNQIYNRYDSWNGDLHNGSSALYTYDEEGRMLTYSFCDSEGTTESTADTYDRYGNLIKTVKTCIYSDGSGYSVIQRNEYDFGEPLG